MVEAAGSPSSTQSTPFTVTHGCVVGPSGGTPQRNRTVAGVPHAPVAWASVSRAPCPATVSGSRTLIWAQPTLLAFGAGSSDTVGAHPLSDTTTAVARSAEAATRRGDIAFRLPFDA
ncbi:MAG: hypothetical protein QOH55_1672 [Microbacteriaceae bacterium]|nr:hypothetical protein [Microbacteriaceae bacterium]